MSSGDGPSGQETGQQSGEGHSQGQAGQGQPQGQAGQGQPQGQPGQPAGQYGGQAAGGASPTDILSQPVGQQIIKYTVALFAVVSAALGLTSMIASQLLNSSFSFGSAAALGSYSTMLFAGGPLLAAILSLRGRFDAGETDQESYVLAFVSSAAGHLVLTIIGGIFTAIAISSGFNFGNAIIAGILLAIGAGLVAAGVMWAEDWSGIDT